MKKAAFVLFSLFLVNTTYAQESQTTYNFLRVPMRAHASCYFHGLPKATALRQEIMKETTEKGFNDVLDSYEKERGFFEPETEEF